MDERWKNWLDLFIRWLPGIDYLVDLVYNNDRLMF